MSTHPDSSVTNKPDDPDSIATANTADAPDGARPADPKPALPDTAAPQRTPTFASRLATPAWVLIGLGLIALYLQATILGLLLQYQAVALMCYIRDFKRCCVMSAVTVLGMLWYKGQLAQLVPGASADPAMLLIGILFVLVYISGTRPRLLGNAQNMDLDEAKLIDLFNSSREAMAICRYADGVTLGFNDTFTEITGWTQEIGVGRPLRDLIRFKQPSTRKLISLIRDNAVINEMPVSLIDSKGRELRGSISGQVVTLNGVLCIFGILHDDRSDEQIKSSVHALEHKLSLMFRSAPNPICVVNLATSDILDVNNAFMELINRNRYNTVGYPLSELLPDLETLVLVPLRLSGKDQWEKTHNTELTISSKRGITLPVSLSAMRAAIDEVDCAVIHIKDISALRRTQHELNASEELFRSVFEHAPIGLLITDSQGGRIIRSNRALYRLIGYTPEELAGRRVEELLVTEDTLAYSSACNRLATGEHEYSTCTVRYQHKTGAIIWGEQQIVMHRTDGGMPKYLICEIRDVTDLRQEQERMEHLAFHDSLTGLANRRLLAEHLQQAVTHTERSKLSTALLYLDLDNFKLVNDQYGHDVGDALLCHTADHLRSCVRKEDTISRLAGDEFVVLLNEVHSAQAAATVAKKILKGMQAPIHVGDHNIQVTASIGITLSPRDGNAVEQLHKNADAAMYRAKERGRNNFQFFTQEINASIIERNRMEKELRLALQSDQFIIHYQPVMHLATRRITCLEALLRWSSDTGELLYPGTFLPVAEQSGTIIDMDQWLLVRACQQIKALQQEIGQPLRLSINASAKWLISAGFADQVKQALEASELPADCLEVEVTEAIVMDDLDQSIPILNSLQKLGVRVSIDDFGIGYSSLNLIRQISATCLKIDGNFTQQLPADLDSAAIVASTIAMAHELGLEVTAEGTETEAQLKFLSAHRCDHAQGYLFGHPQSLEEIRQVLIQTPDAH